VLTTPCQVIHACSFGLSGPRWGSTERLAAAREIAEFLVAYGALGGDNNDLWALGDSCLVRGWQMSPGAKAISHERARMQFVCLPPDLRLLPPESLT
jgi:hypothetical protein